MKWIIQNLHTTDWQLQQAAEKLNLDFQFLPVGGILTKEWFNEYGLIHSSINSVKYLHNQGVLNLTPFNSLRCQDYYTYWGEYLFNNKYTMLPLRECVRRFNELTDYEGGTGLFVRPDSNDKLFTGDVFFSEKELEELITNDIKYVKDSTLVVAAPAYKIDKEWRCFMKRGKVIASSLYKENHELKVQPDESCKDFAESIPMYPGLPPAYVLDIAQAGNQFYLLEPGSVNCAGLYACDPDKVVKLIVESTLELKQEFTTITYSGV